MGGGRKATLTSSLTDSDLIEYIETVRTLVRYSDVVDLGVDDVTVAHFEKLRMLALCDVLTDLSPDERQEVCGWGLQHQSKMRQTLPYQAIKRRIHEIASMLARGDGMLDASEALEPVLTEKMLHTALHGATRDAIASRKEFLDRISAKKGREESFTFRMPTELVEMMEKAVRIEARALPPAAEEDVIDAAIIRRPDE